MGTKITADGDCSLVIGRCLVLRRKYMTNINSLLKRKTSLCGQCEAKAMIFPVVIYGCESWAIKKSECRRSDAFELRCWRRLLRVPWTARSLNQWILREMNHEYSLEVLILKLKFQYFGHLMQRADSLEKTLMLEKIEGKRRRGQQKVNGWMASPIQRTSAWENSGRWWGTGRPDVLQYIGLQRIGYDLGTGHQQQWHAYKIAFDFNGILGKGREKKWKIHSEEIPQYINQLLSITSLRFCHSGKVSCKPSKKRHSVSFGKDSGTKINQVTWISLSLTLLILEMIVGKNTMKVPSKFKVLWFKGCSLI